ncbi:MAG: helix-turn-helix domain-containing protein [Flavobacterium sp.]
MQYSKTGEFYGETNKTVQLEGITLTDTEYTLPNVDWHYHENAYFTFILEGKVLEGNKKDIYTCTPGSLLFHNWEEPHYNIKPDGFTRGFHVEIEQQWFGGLGIAENLQGSINISNPEIKLLMYKIFRETKMDDSVAGLSVDALLTETLSKLGRDQKLAAISKPQWVNTVREILHDRFADNLTLSYLANSANIHPVHLSRDFSKYFNCSLGEYVRQIRVEKALALMSQKKLPLTELALQCGFYDQSHFNRCFREMNGITPSQHKKIFFA